MLTRFLDAQEEAYPRALAEIRAGRKASHWMWFIFPQLKGLGRTDIARYYGIENLQEATEYLNHPVLGERLVEISKALLQQPGRAANAIFGNPDDRKLRSCMTLFSKVKGADPVFLEVLEAFYNGEEDILTRDLMRRT